MLQSEACPPSPLEFFFGVYTLQIWTNRAIKNVRIWFQVWDGMIGWRFLIKTRSVSLLSSPLPTHPTHRWEQRSLARSSLLGSVTAVADAPPPPTAPPPPPPLLIAGKATKTEESPGRCRRGTVGKGKPLREVEPRQNLTETSRFSCVSCTAALCTATIVFHGLPLLISDA